MSAQNRRRSDPAGPWDAVAFANPGVTMRAEGTMRREEAA